MIYFDHAASTAIYPEALEVLNKAFEVYFANPSSNHILGREASKKLEEARTGFLKLLNQKEGQVIFLSSATEANNLVILGLPFSQNDFLIASHGDHPSLYLPCEKTSAQFLELPLKNEFGKLGEIDQEALKILLEKKPKLLSFSWVNNHSGNLHPLKDIISLLRKNSSQTFIHVDASQGFGKFPLDLASLDIDFLSLSSHKMGGPRGVALLWMKKNLTLKPLFFGGGQEFSLRPSTPSLPLILSFLKAGQMSLEKQDQNLKKMIQKNASFIENLKTTSDDFLFPFEKTQTSPYILTLIFKNVSSDILLRLLEEKSIFISSSSACSSKIKGENLVFSALFIEKNFHKNVLRISFSHSSTDEEIQKFFQSLKEVLDSLSFLKK